MYHKIYFRLSIILLVLSGAAVSVPLTGQNVVEPELALQYLKKTDGTVYLQARLSAWDEDKYPLPDQYIRFFTGFDSLQEVGSMYTDRKGIAGINIPPAFKTPLNDEGFFKYIALFEGNDSVARIEAEVEYMDMSLEMILEEIDSVRTVHIRATRESEDGEMVPVAEEDVCLYIPRLFSLLNIAEEWLDEEGEVSVEFPPDLPGDKEGMITVIARIEDHDLYGNVECRQSILWGIPSDHTIPESYRALWTQYAPNWMVITLSILLAGVWSHYIFVIVKLVYIRRKGKEPERLNQRRI